MGICPQTFDLHNEKDTDVPTRTKERRRNGIVHVGKGQKELSNQQAPPPSPSSP